ncbi:non-canonical purine NTP pyrophosphatase, RdgB/HAM1 family [Thiocapsa imhoffii]|uniref:dITP/XTP pyrophosphatase n=1 Tax=Thiocapsa imhoffii TaxID=382777 RepID=A0A9X1B7Q5_9GAMM|nr:RdgB/HAM1 family non-canonical purine NTP pyrophosphatase [Thiocapsa imhoffii]MBK1643265.1 non-canonical purine NTP pyrophosphatase, RdgB/HAM1 family [Thiocapsa imhoffii]
MIRSPLAEPIVLASNNAGKVRELNQLLADTRINVVPQRDFGIPDAAETGLTFVENAIIKARQAARLSGRPAIADDSGLEVDALGGAPGIHSARYAGAQASDADNLKKLLAELEGVDEPLRSARFHCVLVYLAHAHDPTPLICQGTWEGRILRAARGEHGFGYDPIFWVPTHGCSSAELEPAIKNQLSHRGQALRCLRERLEAAHPVASGD